tara:strand:+ start:307 stop:960 length:654 start_codon:yes stop_codon:yes gene_type:complete
MNHDDSEEARLRADEHMSGTEAYYERGAERWAKTKTDSFFHEDEFRHFLSTVSSRDAKVVDLGCAGGLHVPLFLGMGRELHYTGVDLSQAFLEIARRRYPQLTFYQGDLTESDSLPKQSFDAFWCAATFMHIPKVFMPLAAKNIGSICRPGAIGYFTLPKTHPSGDLAKDDPRHFEIMSPEEQRQLIAGFGWKIRYETEKGGFHSPGVWQAYLVELP